MRDLKEDKPERTLCDIVAETALAFVMSGVIIWMMYSGMGDEYKRRVEHMFPKTSNPYVLKNIPKIPVPEIKCSQEDCPADPYHR